MKMAFCLSTLLTLALGLRAETNAVVVNSPSGPRINGVVLDVDGAPAAKVVVSLLPYSSNLQKKTDEAGRFVLTLDPSRVGGGDSPCVLVARDPDRDLAAAQDLDEDATNVTLRLAPGFTLSGRATDSNGKPLANALARLMFRTDRMSSPLGQTVRANGEGRFEIKGLPAGRGFTVTVSAKGYGQDAHDVDTREGDKRRVELDPFQLRIADQRIAGVVLDADDKPVPGAWINCYGDKQGGQNGQSDAKGRFVFDKICVGTVRLSANHRGGGFASAEVEGGDTNIILHLGASGARPLMASTPARLRGKPLPDLVAAGFASVDAPTNQPVLALLIDAEQRPCRRVLRLLGDQAPALKQKGLAVLVLHSGEMAEEAFAAWKQEAATTFPVVRLKQDPDKARVAWGAGALPWLILADKAHRVIAEGFSLDDLDAQLGELK